MVKHVVEKIHILTINVASMTDGRNKDRSVTVINLIDNSIYPNSDAVKILAAS
jgi:hypothetical protein